MAWNLQHIVTVIDADSHYRHLKLELRAVLSTNPAFFRCLSPDCKSGQIHCGADIFTCHECAFKSCWTCKIPWHEGQACHKETAAAQNAKEVRIKAEEASGEKVLKEAYSDQEVAKAQE